MIRRLGVLFAVLPMLLLAAGCKPSPSTVQIRLINRGTVPLENIRVDFVGQVENFGTLAPGETSPYHTVAKSYSYARIDATVAGKPGIVQPTDFVGERLLPPGNYSWSLHGKPDVEEPFGRLLFDGSARDATP